MFYTYIIYSASLDKYYVGHCEDLGKRLLDHNNSRSSYTKTGKPWEVKWFTTFPSRSAAMKEESGIKKKKSRKYIEWMIAN